MLTVLAVLCCVGLAGAQTTSYPSQLNPRNTQTVSVANTAAVKTLTGVANRAWRVYGFSAFCSAGTSTVTLAEAGTTTFSTNTGMIGTTLTGVAFPGGPYTAVAGATVTLTLGTCGGGNVGTLNVQADIH
jgi:hypothetical protein